MSKAAAVEVAEGSAEPVNESSRSGRWWARLTALAGSRAFAITLSVVMLVVAVLVIHEELRIHPWTAILRAFRDIPPSAIAAAVGLTAISFLALSLNERFALSLLGQRQPFTRVLASATATYAVSNCLGFSFATAATVRMRFYTAWGLGAREVAGASALTGLLVPLGGVTAAAMGAIISASELANEFALPAWLIPGGALLGLAPALIWIWVCRRRSHGEDGVKVGGLLIRRPGLTHGAAGLLPAVLDWAAAAGVLYALLPDHGGHDFPEFLAIFVTAGMLGAISGAPGGIGVFEATILALAPSGQGAHEVAAALVLYRLIYTIAPLVLVALASTAALAPRLGARPEARAAGAVALGVAPGVFAILTFTAGAILLLSGATPGLRDRLQDLHATIPLPFTELSHLLGSVVGVLLLFVAAGLWRRLDSAWLAALALLLTGVVFSLLKGFDVEEALILGVLAALLFPCRAAFHRRTPLSRDLITWPWIVAAAAVAGAVAWIGLIAYRHVDYADEMWWSFLRDGDVERSLRATTAAVVMVAIVGVGALIRPSRPKGPAASLEDIGRARRVIAGADAMQCDAWLATTGDKHLLFSESGRSFIMFAKRASRWIAMSEPVGVRSEFRPLIYRFREAADVESAQTAFYSVTLDMLPDMVETGYVVRKIGETAIIALATFSLEGKAKASLRHARNKVQKEGYQLVVLPADDPTTPWDDLLAVSNSWLAMHKGSEKRFSLGRFDRGYLGQTPIAILRRGEEIAAFANLWSTPDGRQISVDLMRYDPSVSRGVMDALFIELMLWGKANGYAEFDLGMAPLSGLETHRLSPFLSRVGALIFEGGERIYGFRGLREFKQKFDPTWRPVYMASSPGMLSPVVLADVALLTSGGIRGLLS